MIVMIDNYDSFTFNLVQYFLELGAEVSVHRADKIDVAGIRKLKPTQLVISPGPCTPNEAGVSVPAIAEMSGELPIFGVCLGHQSLGVAFGGEIVRAKHVMHGKTSTLAHKGAGLFTDVTAHTEIGRYHSLVVNKDKLPASLEITATSEDDGEIMGLRHREHPTVGVQFHPESVLTPEGKKMMANFLEGRLS
jgi:anthranilate synthase/aminodeoxychorismate synthase-like glutamine amidotransferase